VLLSEVSCLAFPSKKFAVFMPGAGKRCIETGSTRQISLSLQDNREFMRMPDMVRQAVFKEEMGAVFKE
jgi:hypothetical protein